ncbi:MAG: flagellar hook-basal body complex protein FliE [Armatimonadota bacterium]|nr:flagellar hook-basal body complex protein FliE [Armatimonadota bacterium]
MSLFAPLTMPASLSAASPFALSDGLQAASQATSNDGTPSFTQTLQNAFGQVNDLQNRAGQMTKAYALGQTSDVHSVMIAGEQATIALQMTAQIRNKVVDAYQEMMRISM